MSIASTVKGNPALKKIVHRMLIPKDSARPRLWVSLFLNRFFHKRHAGSVIHKRTRLDVVPFNKFELGAKSSIEDFCTINNGVGDVIIGDNSLIGIGSVVIGPVSIGNNVIFAQHVVVSGLNHEYKDPTIPIRFQDVTTAKITIGDDCWIAANAVITAGVTIGKHCVIGAGAVVTKDVPSFSVATGNPAKVVKRYDEGLKEWVKVSLSPTLSQGEGDVA